MKAEAPEGRARCDWLFRAPVQAPSAPKTHLHLPFSEAKTSYDEPRQNNFINFQLSLRSLIPSPARCNTDSQFRAMEAEQRCLARVKSHVMPSYHPSNLAIRDTQRKDNNTCVDDFHRPSPARISLRTRSKTSLNLARKCSNCTTKQCRLPKTPARICSPRCWERIVQPRS